MRVTELVEVVAIGDGTFRAVFEVDRDMTETEKGAVRDWGLVKYHHQYTAEPEGQRRIVVVADSPASLNNVASHLVAEGALDLIQKRTAHEQAEAERMQTVIRDLIARTATDQAS